MDLKHKTDPPPETDTKKDICPICRSSLEEKEVETTLCSHVFHGECINKWYKTKEHCPICRKTRAEAFMEQKEKLATLMNSFTQNKDNNSSHSNSNTSNNSSNTSNNSSNTSNNSSNTSSNRRKRQTLLKPKVAALPSSVVQNINNIHEMLSNLMNRGVFNVSDSNPMQPNNVLLNNNNNILSTNKLLLANTNNNNNNILSTNNVLLANNNNNNNNSFGISLRNNVISNVSNNVSIPDIGGIFLNLPIIPYSFGGKYYLTLLFPHRNNNLNSSWTVEITNGWNPQDLRQWAMNVWITNSRREIFLEDAGIKIKRRDNGSSDCVPNWDLTKLVCGSKKYVFGPAGSKTTAKFVVYGHEVGYTQREKHKQLQKQQNKISKQIQQTQNFNFRQSNLDKKLAYENTKLENNLIKHGTKVLGKELKDEMDNMESELKKKGMNVNRQILRKAAYQKILQEKQQQHQNNGLNIVNELLNTNNKLKKTYYNNNINNINNNITSNNNINNGNNYNSYVNNSKILLDALSKQEYKPSLLPTLPTTQIIPPLKSYKLNFSNLKNTNVNNSNFYLNHNKVNSYPGNGASDNSSLATPKVWEIQAPALDQNGNRINNINNSNNWNNIIGNSNLSAMTGNTLQTITNTDLNGISPNVNHSNNINMNRINMNGINDINMNGISDINMNRINDINMNRINDINMSSTNNINMSSANNINMNRMNDINMNRQNNFNSNTSNNNSLCSVNFNLRSLNNNVNNINRINSVNNGLNNNNTTTQQVFEPIRGIYGMPPTKKRRYN